MQQIWDFIDRIDWSMWSGPALSALRIVLIVVPSATKKVAHRCTRSLTLPWPNSMMPRKPASRKNAVSTS